jgi:sodium-dependent dicarboxylate transporter 2/3/5
MNEESPTSPDVSGRTGRSVLFLLYLLASLVLPWWFDLTASSAVSVFLVVVGLWMTEALPLPVTGVLVPILAVLFGLLPAKEAFRGFGDEIILLFLGCFLLARAMEKTGLDRRLAYLLLTKLMPGNSFRTLTVMVASSSFFLSMWISNTSATAIVVAIVLGIHGTLQSNIPSPAEARRAAVRLLLATAFGASIGGISTPIGSPPNLLAVRLLAERGLEVSFLQWVMIGFPTALLLLAVMLLVLEFLLPLPGLNFPTLKPQLRSMLQEAGPMSAAERLVAVIGTLTVAGWVLPEIVGVVFGSSSTLEFFQGRLSSTVVALSAAILLFVSWGRPLPAVLEWQDAQKIDWGTLLLFGGGLTLARVLDSSGLATHLGELLTQGGFTSVVAFGSVVVVAAVVLSEFASNTAAASVLLPMTLGMSISLGLTGELTIGLVTAVTIAGSLGFMMPVSTPPNAIAYGTGLVPARDMKRCGGALDLLGAALVILTLVL